VISIALSAIALFAAPQGGHPLGFEALPCGMQVGVAPVVGSEHVAIAALVACGGVHDPLDRTGFATVVEMFLRASQETWPESERFAVESRERATALTATVPAARAAPALRRLRTLLGELDVTKSAFATALARARLEIDDATNVFPGPMLRWRAQRAVFAGTPAGRAMIGVDAEVGKIDEAAFRERYLAHYRPSNTWLALVGGVDAAALRATVAETFAGADGGSPAIVPPAPETPPAPIEAQTVHPMVDAAFVSVTFAMPHVEFTDNLPFLVALQLVRARAARAFGEPRQGELQARFPYMFASYWEGNRLVMLNRRARNGESPRAPLEEIEQLLFAIRDYGLPGEEIGAAAAVVGHTLTLPPYPRVVATAMAKEPRAMGAKAFVYANAGMSGWPPDLGDRIGAVRVGDVQKAFVQIYDPSRWHVLALLPKERAKPKNPTTDGK
jgi:hypothetical protein